jgi:light-regulated signal transduction histidine kinase (bacteriophytochrome)
LALNKNFQKNISIVQTLETNPKYSGTGLDLAICCGIVENHKGFIKVKPNVILFYSKGIYYLAK